MLAYNSVYGQSGNGYTSELFDILTSTSEYKFYEDLYNQYLVAYPDQVTHIQNLIDKSRQHHNTNGKQFNVKVGTHKVAMFNLDRVLDRDFIVDMIHQYYVPFQGQSLLLARWQLSMVNAIVKVTHNVERADYGLYGLSLGGWVGANKKEPLIETYSFELIYTVLWFDHSTSVFSYDFDHSVNTKGGQPIVYEVDEHDIEIDDVVTQPIGEYDIELSK